MTKKLNFLVDNLGASQLSYYVTRNINRLGGSGDWETCCMVFYDTMHRNCMLPTFPIMNMSEAWMADGVSVATSISTAQKLIKFPGPKKKLYYVWDLVDLPFINYDAVAAIIQNPELEIVARGPRHQRVLDNNYNVKARVVDDCDIKQLLEN